MCDFHFQFHHTRLAVILKTWFNVAPKNTFFFTGKGELFTHFLVTVQRFVRYRLQYSTLQCCRSGSGSGAFLTFGSELGNKSRSGSWMNIPVHISERLETFFGLNLMRNRIRVRNLVDSGSGIQEGKIRIRVPVLCKRCSCLNCFKQKIT
jgi:hypothetical protein